MRAHAIIGIAAGATTAFTAAAHSQMITEVRIGQPGTNTDSFVEIMGSPDSSLKGLSLIVIGDSDQFPPQQNGYVELAVPLSGTMPSDGILVIAGSSFTQGTPDIVQELSFEVGDNLTLMIVDGLPGVGFDVDTNDDGVIDNSPGTIIDSVALIENGSPDGFNNEYFYSDFTIGPINNLPPQHAWTCNDDGSWRAGDDALGGENENPGSLNADCGGGNGGDIVISEIRIDQPSSDVDEFVEIRGPAGTSLAGMTYIVIGDNSSALSGGFDGSIDLSAMTIPASGYLVIAEDTFTLGVADEIASLPFENSDTVTHAIVLGYDSAVEDIDVDDDGVIDTPAWTQIVDSVGIQEKIIPTSSSDEWAYGDTIVPPNGSYVAGGIYRCDPDDNWVVADFADTSLDHTPGAMNLPCPSDVGCGIDGRACTEAQTGPGCTDSVVCDQVCINDPSCCDTEWDSQCADAATGLLASGDAPVVELSEMRTKQSGTDFDEYVELTGAGSSSLNGLSIVLIGSNGVDTNGMVLEHFNLLNQSMPSDGFFVIGNDGMQIATPDYALPTDITDGGNMTFALVWNFTGARGIDLDTNDDGTLDSTPWESLVSAIATTGDSLENFTYLGAEEVGPDGNFGPGHIYKCVSGEWSVSSFNIGEGLDSPGVANPECGSGPISCGSPDAGDCYTVNETPGCDDEVCCSLVNEQDPFCNAAGNTWDNLCVAYATNLCLPLSDVVPDVQIAEIRIDQPSVDGDEYIEITGEAGTSLDNVWIIVVGDGTTQSGTIELALPMGGQAIASDGVNLTARASLTLGSADYTVRGSDNGFFENNDNLTFLLVFGFTGMAGDDLDADDDGTVDSEPWVSIIDSVAIIESDDYGNTQEWVYSNTIVGPRVDEGDDPDDPADDSFFSPAHIWKCLDSGTWNIGDIDPAASDPSQDTPGDENPNCGDGKGGDCPADLDSDGEVGGSDVGLLLAAWGTINADLNGDGTTGGADVGLLLSAWGLCN
jgi:hypothetical protein